jgi:hypothetical protein
MVQGAVFLKLWSTEQRGHSFAAGVELIRQSSVLASDHVVVYSPPLVG